MALLHIARATVPDMIAGGGGAIIATGNTSAYRGKAGFAAFAPSKAAQRILLESIARHAGPMGVHAAYVAIDAVIDVPWTRKMATEKPDDFFARPADIAEEVFRMAHQPRSAWSFESVIRPFGEAW
jgi:NAD(P)-dependent dehydrogenase (short-subunit alcohol dehydrogenase family)